MQTPSPHQHTSAAAAAAAAELSQRLTIPPHNMDNALRNNPIAVAHAVLEELRDTGDPSFLFLRTVIEINSQHFNKNHQEELLFHCITGVRQVTLWHWRSYSLPFLQTLRNYMMILGDELKTSRTVRMACYTTSVSFWKRSWNEDTNTNNNNNNNSIEVSSAEQTLIQAMSNKSLPRLNTSSDLFKYLDTTVFQPGNSRQIEGALFLNTLVTEFSGKSAVSYRLPIEFHKKAHHAFEKQSLTHCLRLAVTLVSQIVNNSNNSTLSNQLSSAQELTSASLQLTIDCITWEFGFSAWDTGNLGASSSTRTIIRPPFEWREYLGRPDFLTAMFQLESATATTTATLSSTGQSVRQLLLVLASLSGAIFLNNDEKKLYASRLLDGSLDLLQRCPKTPDTTTLSDCLQIVGRIINNFRLTTLVELSNFVTLLQYLVPVGLQLLSDQVSECREAHGDLEMMEHREWREELLTLLLECTVSLASDPWLLYSGTEDSRNQARNSLSVVLGPLYEGFVDCRTQMAAMEEYYMVSNDANLDEVREEILAIDLQEEITSLSVLGRLNLQSALACLSSHFSATMPKLQAFWEGNGEVTPEISALLEQSRLLLLYISHLLNDNNEGETPSIPDAVLMSCENNTLLAQDIASAVQAIFCFAEAQTHKVAANPSNLRLSPLLAKSFLYFLCRWAPAYIYPKAYLNSQSDNPIVKCWSTEVNAQYAVSFCYSLCLYYQCYWPHERLLQESATKLMMTLGKRGRELQNLVVASPAFNQIVQFFTLTARLRHTVSRQEFEATINNKIGSAQNTSIKMLWGYLKLAYMDRSSHLTAILIACSDTKNEAGTRMFNESLKCVHESFTSLLHAISTKQVDYEDVNAKEMTYLCIGLFTVVARASEMNEAERVPKFLVPYLLQLSGLMQYYASDLTICEALLQFFCGFIERFVAYLDRDESVALFQASAELLKSYSTFHCASRVIVKRSNAEAIAEEDQAYNDILCAIQLLINLGAKDFIDICKVESNGVESSQVTDMIFYGLQHILPLMTQGLLQFPTLCSQFFELVGFMTDTYPDKVCELPYELFSSLLESLLFGMSHHDANVGRSSLQGLGSLAKEQISSNALQRQLSQRPNIIDYCTRRLFTEVIFQPVVLDRVEAAGMALLPLAAVDVSKFAAVLTDLTNQVPNAQHRQRLQVALEALIQSERLAKVAAGGYEGRMNRVQFKNAFQDFVHEIHSFLLIK